MIDSYGSLVNEDVNGKRRQKEMILEEEFRGRKRSEDKGKIFVRDVGRRGRCNTSI